MNKILIVEDEEKIANLIKINLVNAGYNCTCVFDGIAAADLIEDTFFDLIILDIMLPKLNGYELMEYITSFNIPTIFLSAKSTIQDKVKGLKLGAEDYLTKPFSIVELLARVETVMRRYNKNSTLLNIDSLQINTISRVVKKNGCLINLTLKEYELLIFFIQNKNIALCREQIYERIWESEYTGNSRTVDLHVQRLRKKIGWEDKITAVYKIGYRLEV